MNTTLENPMANRATVTFHTTPEIKERLDRLASVTQRSKSFLTNEAVQQYLEAEEEFVSKTLQGIEDADASRTYSSAQARTMLRKHIEKIAKTSKSV